MTTTDEMYFDDTVSFEHRQGFREGLEKALELTNDLIQNLKDDKKIEQAMWVEVIRDWITLYTKLEMKVELLRSNRT